MNIRFGSVYSHLETKYAHTVVMTGMWGIDMQ